MLISKEGVRRFILKEAKARRKGWRCRRVAGDVYDTVEYKAGRVIFDFVEHLPRDTMVAADIRASAKQEKLLVRAAVKKKMVTDLRVKYPMLIITGVSEAAVDIIEAYLAAWLVDNILSHPTRGQTFTI
ncbi:MAG: hypothetical protein WC992_07090 [Acholeplasmataceae bacterium]|jgi:hypothetical protein